MAGNGPKCYDFYCSSQSSQDKREGEFLDRGIHLSKKKQETKKKRTVKETWDNS